MRLSQALINKTPWVAVYPAFFAYPINVYQSGGGSLSSCSPLSLAPQHVITGRTRSCDAATQGGSSLGGGPEATRSPEWRVGKIIVRDAAMLVSIMVLLTC